MKKQYTDEDEAMVVKYHGMGMTYMMISDIVDIELRTVYTILKKHGITKPKMQSQRPINDADKENIVQMFNEGFKQTEIAAAYGKHSTTIRRILIEAGVLYDGGKNIPDASSRLTMYTNASNSIRRLLSDAILPGDIEDMKRQIKVGDCITVRSLKSGESMNSSGTLVGRRCTAEVIDVDHPKFIGVKLPKSGATEYFLWRDFVMADRKAQEQETIA